MGFAGFRPPHLRQSLLGPAPAWLWWRLLRENRFAVAPRCWSHAAAITLASPIVSWACARERRLHGAAVAATRIDMPPLFVLGHWRSGTTLLHHLLALDPQFAWPSTYESIAPGHFLSTGETWPDRLAWALPPQRLTDAMRQRMDEPLEDEVALALLSGLSPMLEFCFPRNAARYARCLTLDTATQEDQAAWEGALLEFARKLTLRGGGRPLLLKSPPHTARIRRLLGIFPGARFVHIHRDPIAVLQSHAHFRQAITRHSGLQTLDEAECWSLTLERYTELFSAYFRDEPLVPENRLHTVAFTELERDPVGTLESIYAGLGLEGIASLRPVFEREAARLRKYSKSYYAPLEAARRADVARVAAPVAERWGYAL